MSAAWVAGSVRARALVARRRMPGIARRIAGRPNLGDALRLLAATPYGHDVREGQDVLAAQHAVAATLLWHLRVLAGWLPPRGAALLRVLAGWFEIADVEARLLGGPAFDMGALATVRPGLRSAADLRAALAASPWGDPGGSDDRAVRLGMRISWARRVAAVSVDARPWAAGALALLVARERFLTGETVPVPPSDGALPVSPADRAAPVSPSDGALPVSPAGLLVRDAGRAGGLAELSRRLPGDAAWALQGVAGEHDLWAAEARWWTRVERDAADLLAGAGHGPEPVLGAVALLAADARRVRAALELAARGGSVEAFDAFAG
ncbi:hypothetical protein [Actinoallomurus soli]|uniref:hypothetical protein n=1 Tax=Actinoallomurus soli TaxID=2952535 RepID=UPI002092C3F7|nr:hypothetical protein [Actinoallomurus soli]MCO5967790.1 hypothetical protein [Actinoallomurus soli]